MYQNKVCPKCYNKNLSILKIKGINLNENFYICLNPYCLESDTVLKLKEDNIFYKIVRLKRKVWRILKNVLIKD